MIDWAIAEDNEAELKFAASADAGKEAEAALEAESTYLLEYSGFKDLIACTKSIAQKSGKSCLSPLIVLCAAAVTDQARVTVVEENVVRIKSIAERQGIDLEYGEKCPPRERCHWMRICEILLPRTRNPILVLSYWFY